jgi:hypothetical protein
MRLSDTPTICRNAMSYKAFETESIGCKFVSSALMKAKKKR